MGGSESKPDLCINGTHNKAIQTTKSDMSSHVSFIDCSSSHGGVLIGALLLLFVILGVTLYIFKKRLGLLSSTCRSCRGENRKNLKEQHLLKDISRAQLGHFSHLSNSHIVSPVPELNQVGLMLYIFCNVPFNTII